MLAFLKAGCNSEMIARPNYPGGALAQCMLGLGRGFDVAAHRAMGDIESGSILVGCRDFEMDLLAKPVSG